MTPSLYCNLTYKVFRVLKFSPNPTFYRNVRFFMTPTIFITPGMLYGFNNYHHSWYALWLQQFPSLLVCSMASTISITPVMLYGFNHFHHSWYALWLQQFPSLLLCSMTFIYYTLLFHSLSPYDSCVEGVTLPCRRRHACELQRYELSVIHSHAFHQNHWTILVIKIVLPFCEGYERETSGI